MSYIEELFGLRGRVAVVTGGYGHLGRAMCMALARAGAMVYCAGHKKESFEQAFEPFFEQAASEQRGELHFLPLDLKETEQQQKALRQLPRLDILVNNAFFLTPRPDKGEDEDTQSFQSDMDGLLNAHVHLTEMALPYLKASDQGRIINIASMYGMVAADPNLYAGYPQFCSRASYAAGKAALLQITKYWASFWGQKDQGGHNHGQSSLTVNAISPGPFPRREILADSRNAGFAERLCQNTVLGRLGQPEDLAGALLLLAGAAGSYITGANLVVDGGWTIR